MNHVIMQNRRRDWSRGLASGPDRRTRHGLRPVVLALEDCRLLSTIVVNNPTDTPVMGEIDLRQAIAQANSTGKAETIVFNSTVFKTPQTITLGGSALDLSDTSGQETITGPTAGVTISGGGHSGVFQVDAGATATLSGLTISGSFAQIGGGAYNVSTGTATFTDCTLNGNSVAGDGGSSSGGALFDQGKATLTNCTIAGNSAAESGGGIEAHGTVTVTFSTFSGNQAIYGGAIDNNFGRYTVTLEDTILAGDSATTGPEFCNSVTSAGHNLVAEIDGSSGWVGSDLTGTTAHPLNALLAPLAFYGGPTQIIALLPGSPAIGTGIAVSGVTTDQRGVTRPGTGVDIGAFQSRGFTLTPVSGSTPQTALIDTAFANALGVKVTAKDSAEPVVGGVIAFTAPSSGATAALSAATATIGSSGVASVNATANNTGGSYKVTATAAGAATAASFAQAVNEKAPDLKVTECYGSVGAWEW
jgi:predicted outer membrane repeat protein